MNALGWVLAVGVSIVIAAILLGAVLDEWVFPIGGRP